MNNALNNSPFYYSINNKICKRCGKTFNIADIKEHIKSCKGKLDKLVKLVE